MSNSVLIVIIIAYAAYWAAVTCWLRRSERKRAAETEEAIRQAAAFLAALYGEDEEGQP